MKKVFKIITRILLGMMAFVLVLCMGIFCWSKVHYHDFFKDAQRSMAIPGLNDGFVPQGFDYEEKQKVFLISGYMKDPAMASRIYVVKEDGSSTYAELLDEKGVPFTGHCGGVAINGDYLYLSSDETVLSVFSLAQVMEGEQAKQLGTIDTTDRTSFCSFENGYLLTGAFYRAGNYETPEYHHQTTPAGDENPALIWIFPADENAPFGIADTPVAALSVREKVQGVTVTDEGRILLSTSYSVASSTVWMYEMDTRMGSVNVNGKDVPLYYLDSDNLVEQVEVPPMSEELVFLDGRVYVLTESACTKYIFGNLIDGRHVFSYQF